MKNVAFIYRKIEIIFLSQILNFFHKITKFFLSSSVTKKHTVSEIIQSFHLTQNINNDNASQNKKYVFIFKWKHSERALPPSEKPLLLSQNFKESDCKFIIRITNTESTKRLVLCKDRKCKVEISKTSNCLGVAQEKKRYSCSHFHVKSNKASGSKYRSRTGGGSRNTESTQSNANTNNSNNNNSTNNNSMNNISNSSNKK